MNHSLSTQGVLVQKWLCILLNTEIRAYIDPFFLVSYFSDTGLYNSNTLEADMY